VTSLNNLDTETLRKMVALVQLELKVPGKNTTLYKRSLISANDERPSAVYVGTFGIIVLTFVLGTIVFVDVSNLLRLRKCITCQ